MGMFLYVRKDDNDRCPHCNELLKDNFQTKSSGNHDPWGGCCERHTKPLGMIEKNECDNYHTICEHCDKWIEFNNDRLN